jgi:hypothetical protein
MAQTVWADDALLRSMLLPGSGQAERGHYGRATLFASAAVLSGVGIFISQIHYDRAAEGYNDAKRSYIALSDRLDRGDLVSYEEITSTYENMQSNLDRAENRYAWRNVFLVTFIGSYALNIADLLLSGRSTGEDEAGLSFEFDGESMKIIKCVRF